MIDTTATESRNLKARQAEISGLPISVETAPVTDPVKFWEQIGNRICAYLKAIGVTDEIADKHAREVIRTIASNNTDWASGDTVFAEAMQHTFSRIASARNSPDLDNDEDEDFTYVRICLWLSGAHTELNSYCDKLQQDLPLVVDEFGHLRLDSMPTIERMHMVPGDIQNNMFHNLMNRTVDTEK